ncbi:MAG: HDOD domain-containing protein, partial [Candidatus Zixiibacteriota bacterium]
YNHSQVGAILAEGWKLPARLTEGIAHHHLPQLSESEDPISYIVHISNYVAKRTFYDEDEQHLVGDLEDGVLSFMQLDEGQLDEFGEMLREEYLKAETFMQMAGLT